MIIVSISGGLGNQLFQYSAAIAKSGLKPKDVVLDLGFFELSGDLGATPRSYKLSELGLEGLETINLLESRIKRTKAKMLSFMLPGYYYEEIIETDPFKVDQRVFSTSKNIVYLNGYWQWRQHAEYSASLMKTLVFRSAILNGRKQDIFSNTDLDTRVAIHIRRGDYSEEALTCSKEYYHKSMADMKSRLGEDLTWFIFSDDIGWAKANIRPPGKSYYISDEQSRSDIDDFCAMASIRYHIISNSTFSWWAAFASSTYYRQSVIIAPIHWWKSIPASNISIYPKTWIVTPG